MKNLIVIAILGLCFGQVALAQGTPVYPPSECFVGYVNQAGETDFDRGESKKVNLDEYNFAVCELDKRGERTVCLGTIAPEAADGKFKTFSLTINQYAHDVHGEYFIGGIQIDTHSVMKPGVESSQTISVWCK